MPESLSPNVDNIELYFETSLLSLDSIFTQFEKILCQANPNINSFSICNEYMHIIHFCLTNFQVHLHAPYKLWQFLASMRADKDWSNIFTMIELCICALCSNAELERFFSQMRVVKTDWCNRLSEENLTCLLRIKVAGPTLKSFHDDYCKLAINRWFNDKHRRIGQTQCKKYKKRKASKKSTLREFDLLSIFEPSSGSEEDVEDIEEDIAEIV